MKNNTVKTLGELELRELVDLGLRMPDGSTELFEVVNIANDYVTVMTKNIIDFMPFDDNRYSDDANPYTKSSIRSFLKKLYQSVTKENKLLEIHTFGNREFFLPSIVDLGFGNESEKGWQSFKDNASRIKYTGAFASTKEESHGYRKVDWYWTSTSSATYDNSAYRIHHDGTLRNSNVYHSLSGVTPAVILKSSVPVNLVNSTWQLCDSIFDIPNSESTKIKTGDWVEVTHTAEIDIQEGILLGDCLEVTSVKANGDIIVKLPSAEVWCLLPDQVRKIELPLPHYKKSKELADFSERLEGYYQHTAIEILKVYHTAHKVKEERIKALNKALENIQELIKLEKHN